MEGEASGNPRHCFVLLFVDLLVFFLLVPIVHELGEVLNPAVPPVLEGFGFVVVLGGRGGIGTHQPGRPSPEPLPTVRFRRPGFSRTSRYRSCQQENGAAAVKKVRNWRKVVAIGALQDYE